MATNGLQISPKERKLLTPILGKQIAASPEAIFAEIGRLGRDMKNATNASKLFRIKRALDPSDWNMVVKSAVQRLGTPGPGQPFSHQVLMQRMKAMPHLARQLLFA